MFIRVRFCSLGHLKVTPGAFAFALVHSIALRGRRVHSSSREFIPVVACFSCFAWVLSGAPRGRSVHLDSHGLTQAQLVVDGFISVHVGSLGGTNCSPGSFGFAGVRVAGFIRVLEVSIGCD